MKPLTALALVSALAVTACGPSKPKPMVGATQTLAHSRADFKPAQGSASANDIARFLAGKPVANGERLSAIQQTGDYQNFAGHMAKNGYIGNRRFGVIRGWAESNVTPAASGQRVLLYPFGGPDLFYANAMFPAVSTYVLFGLEPVGSLPNLEAADPSSVNSALPGLYRALETELTVGYFITEDMRRDLGGTILHGVTPLLLSTISLLDGTVDSVSGINAAGRNGVDIQWRNREGVRRRVIYVSGDLSNGGFNSGLQSWTRSLGPSATYFKAASYLMHDDRFSNLRSFVMNQSQVILQDDSGIPYKYYDQGKWEIRLHGDYSAPIPLFTKHSQSDLRAAYQSIGGGPSIPFGSGYHTRPREANLMIAVKR